MLQPLNMTAEDNPGEQSQPGLHKQIPDKNLTMLINNFSRVEDLPDFFCSICNDKIEAKKKDEVNTAPSHLILTINSFEFIKETFTKKKILHDIQLEDNLSIFETSNSISKYYILYGIIIHKVLFFLL